MSEERIIPDAAEFASAASRATVAVHERPPVAAGRGGRALGARRPAAGLQHRRSTPSRCSRSVSGLRSRSPLSPTRHAGVTGATGPRSCCRLAFAPTSPLRYATLTDEIALHSAQRTDHQRPADRADHGGKPPHQRLGLRQHDRGMAVYVYISPHLSGRFSDALRLARAHDGLSRPRHQRRDRIDPARRGHRGDPLHDSRAGPGEDRRRRFLCRYFDGGHGPLPRWRGQNSGASARRCSA